MTIVKYLVLSSHGLISQEQCNDLGKDGWILTTIHKEQAIRYYYFFRVEEEIEPPPQSTVTRMDAEIPTSPIIH